MTNSNDTMPSEIYAGKDDEAEYTFWYETNKPYDSAFVKYVRATRLAEIEKRVEELLSDSSFLFLKSDERNAFIIGIQAALSILREFNGEKNV